MNIHDVLLSEYQRHFDSLEKIKTEYINTYRVFADGTKFQYEGETCEVVGATFVFDPDIVEISIIDVNELLDFLSFADFSPDRTIWYLIDNPNRPELKVTLSQAVLRKRKALEPKIN